MCGIRWAQQQLCSQRSLTGSLESASSYILKTQASLGLTSSDPRILTCPLASNIHLFPTSLIKPQVIFSPWCQWKHFDLLMWNVFTKPNKSRLEEQRTFAWPWRREEKLLTAFQLCQVSDSLGSLCLGLHCIPHWKHSWASCKGSQWETLCLPRGVLHTPPQPQATQILPSPQPPCKKIIGSNLKSYLQQPYLTWIHAKLITGLSAAGREHLHSKIFLPHRQMNSTVKMAVICLSSCNFSLKSTRSTYKIRCFVLILEKKMSYQVCNSCLL